MFLSLFNSDNTLSTYDSDKLYTIQKADIDYIVDKALEIKPDLFKDKYEIGVSPKNNTVYIWKHAPIKVNSFEQKDMIFATCIQVSKTDKEINRVCAIYCEPQDFNSHILPTAIEGFEINNAMEKAKEEQVTMENTEIKYKLQKLEGIEKQDLFIAGELEKVFNCVEKDERVNDRNEFLINLFTIGNFEEMKDEEDVAYLKNKTKPQYIYKAYQFLQDALGKEKNIKNIAYDVEKCQVSFEKQIFNSFNPNGKWVKTTYNVINDYIERENAFFNLKSTEDKDRFKQNLDLANQFHGDGLRARLSDFDRNFYLIFLKNSRVSDYKEAQRFTKERSMLYYDFEHPRKDGQPSWGVYAMNDEEFEKYGCDKEYVKVNGIIYENTDERKEWVHRLIDKYYADHPEVERTKEKEKADKEPEKKPLTLFGNK